MPKLEELGFEALYPNCYRVIKEVVKAARGSRKDDQILSEIEELAGSGNTVPRGGRRKTSLFDLLQNGAQKSVFTQSRITFPRDRQ